MNFKDFVISMPAQTDKKIKAFVERVKKDKNFPTSSEPSKLSIYLYKILNHDETSAFQNLLLIYASMPFNELPKRCHSGKDMMLMAANIIIGLQNFDNEYNWRQ